MTDQDAESSCSLEKPLALRLGQAEDSNDRSQTATVDDDNPPDDPGHERTSRDDSNDDDDSTFGEATSSTTSKLVEEDPLVIRGRKHRSMVQGVHPWIPNDEKQRDVMDIKHYVATNLFDGALYQAPLTENIQGVLDVGTGTGLWAIDFADKYPHASVIGIDLFPIQPTWVPPNLRFELDDCTQEWTQKEESFDYVHMRQLTGSISDWASLFGEAFKCLKPGGFLESHEQSLYFWHNGQIRIDQDLGKLTNAVAMWNAVFKEAGRQSGRSFVVADGDTQMESMKAAGFTNLKEYRKQASIETYLFRDYQVTFHYTTDTYRGLGQRREPQGDWLIPTSRFAG
ncbi:hypothetical protein ACJZ2D_013316 [Fusarium nematophilum]